MSPFTKTRMRGAGEVRVRSGCWKCRERRVKCPEQRPICHHCKRLGLPCRYEIRLTWDGVGKISRTAPSSTSWGKGTSPCWSSYDIAVSEWMFLNATIDDFQPACHDIIRATPRSGLSRSNGISNFGRCSPNLYGNVPPSPAYEYAGSSPSDSTLGLFCPPSSPLSPFPISLHSTESRLLDYFIHFMTPRCALFHNPYQDVLLRLAVTNSRGLLFDCIMAVAANQMHIMGHGESVVSALGRRDRALSALRRHVLEYSGSSQASAGDGFAPKALSPSQTDTSDTSLIIKPPPADQLIWSAVMMCFFDISLDCPQSWEVHAEFATSLLFTEAARQPYGHVSDSHQFAAAYLSSHYILSCTATSKTTGFHHSLNSDSSNRRFDDLQRLTDDSFFRTLTGCSKDLMSLIGNITELALHPDIHQLRNNIASPASMPSPITSIKSPSPQAPYEESYASSPAADLQRRRDAIERGLHMLAEPVSDNHVDLKNGALLIDCDPPPSSPSIIDPSYRIREAKRLAALMYLYARIDGCDPCRPHMMRLTSRIVALIAGISTRTNTVLWPLFIVATLGVRPECEEDRRTILSKLAELQQTRQLGNVRKARQVIEDVWRARDLGLTDATRGWGILQGRLDIISLA